MTSSSKIEGKQLLVNGKPYYIRGGEIQYFRLAVGEWEDRLKKARDGGLNTVSSYMPWYFHESREGAVDLVGKTDPQRNLRRFLNLAADLGLKVIARPGPFINSELRCGGIPEWLFRNHPETMSRRADGRVSTGRPIPAEGEPLYRQYVRRWYQQVVPLIAEYDIHRGGPVILFQPDNELSAAWSFGLLNSLYDPAVLATWWPEWLQRQYHDPVALASRYNCEVRLFQGVEPPRAFPTESSEKRRCIDWLNFKRWFFADWATVMAKWAIEDGIQVPMIFNEPVAGFYEHGDHAGFGTILKNSGIQGTTACHTYSPPLIDLDGAVGIALAVEVTKSSPWGGPPLSIEVNTNWYLPRLSRSEINWEALLRLGFGYGLAGSVMYPYAAGTVSLSDVIDGVEYWDPSAIDVTGNPAYAYGQLQQFHRFVASWESSIVDSDRVADVTLAYCPAQRLLDFLGAPALLDTTSQRTAAPGGDSFSAEPVLNRSSGSPGHDWLDGYEGVSKQTIPAESGLWKKTKEALLLLTRLNVAAEMRDLMNSNRTPGDGWIIVPCTGSLEKEAVDYLLHHLDQGGGCLFFPTVPVFNLDGQPDRRLADHLGVRLVRQVQPAGGEPIDYGTRRIDFGTGDQTSVNGWIFIHDFSHEANIIARYQDQPVVVVPALKKGQAVVAGLDLSFTNVSSLRLWQSLFRDILKVHPKTEVTGNYYHTQLRQGKDFDILTISNISGRNGPAVIHLPQWNISFEINLKPHEARCLVLGVDLAGKSKKLIYTTSEIIPLDSDRRSLELYGREGTTGELAFAEPMNALLDGETVGSIPDANGRHVLHYRHGEKPLRMELR